MTNITTVNTHEQRLQAVTEPSESKQIEAAALAARAWAKEQKDYEVYISAVHLYIMARRRTTELIQPNIQHGGNFQGNNVVTLNDFGFTKMQWNRRVKELALSQDEIEQYFDECIAKHWEPSLFGLWRYREPQAQSNGAMCTCPVCGKEHRKETA